SPWEVSAGAKSGRGRGIRSRGGARSAPQSPLFALGRGGETTQTVGEASRGRPGASAVPAIPPPGWRGTGRPRGACRSHPTDPGDQLGDRTRRIGDVATTARTITTPGTAIAAEPSKNPVERVGHTLPQLQEPDDPQRGDTLPTARDEAAVREQVGIEIIEQ